ncbi:MAG: hypothetical protein AAGJ53_10395, partial [Pseudomonadota bacterium]
MADAPRSRAEPQSLGRYLLPLAGGVLLIAMLIGPGLFLLRAGGDGPDARAFDPARVLARLGFAPDLDERVAASKSASADASGRTAKPIAFGRDPSVISPDARANERAAKATSEKVATVIRPSAPIGKSPRFASYTAEPDGGDLDAYHWGMVRGVTEVAPKSPGWRKPTWQAGRFGSKELLPQAGELEAPKASKTGRQTVNLPSGYDVASANNAEPTVT